ncbi:MAG: hypothetical protein GF344_06645 [Chitinivibrionales bacterium]|nr:hypothetical protein [Chitinivibrionales bacterium]MBD3356605.1 hypothetical protein [Chitinivibrionales bacterium]
MDLHGTLCVETQAEETWELPIGSEDEWNRKFSFLDETIPALLVSGELSISKFIDDAFSEAPAYKLVTVHDVQHARALLNNGKRRALCILDVGMRSESTSEFRLIKDFVHDTIFIAVSSANSMEKGFEACRAGARLALCTKGLSADRFRRKANHEFLHSLLYPPRAEGDTIIRCAAKAVESFRPRNVNAWADSLNMSDTYLRRRYTLRCGITPKLVLFLHTLYALALKKSRPLESGIRRTNRFEAFYRKHQKQIEKYLN